MAGTIIVTTVTEKLTSMLADAILQEVSLVTGFREDFEFLCQQVGSIEYLLNELADRRNSRSMSNWIENLEDFVDDAMDILEECRVPPTSLFRSCKFGNPVFRYKMGRKIKKLKEKITKIHADAKFLKYLTFASILDVNARVLNNSEDQRERSTSLIRESQTVGMEQDVNAITELLLSKDAPRVIAVVGMGGQGKTLLAQHLFKSVRTSFDHQVWLAVSEKYSVKQLLLDVGYQINLHIPDQNLSEQVLSDRIRKDLEDTEKSLLLVVDDVWATDAFGKIGLIAWQGKIKIVVTTRNKNVAEAMPNRYIHEMKPLIKELSLELFCIHAFPDLKEQTPPPELASIADSIVEKCSGLPLAVKTVGGYMATQRRLPNDWQRALDRLNEAAPMSDKVMSSLRLSYEALPKHLKACFVYCSVFPKNTEIKSDYLVYAWIAQEFVSTQVPAKEAYDLGRSYIDQLIDRCLMEVSEVGSDGRVRSCKMHDLLHDLALSESMQQTKCLVKPGGDFEKLAVEDCRGSRRISLMKNDIITIEEDIQCPGLRTLLLSDNLYLESISASFFNNLRYLSVLDLSWTSINLLPESVEELKHLKFLNLSGTKIEILPESLSGLRRLQFLDVSDCLYLKGLHKGIGNHQCMLHLNMNDSSGNIKFFPEGISKLTSLQTLKDVVFGRSEIGGGNANALQLTDLKGLRLLRHLLLTINTSSSSKGIQLEECSIQLEEGIFGGMKNMRALHLQNYDLKRFLHLSKEMDDLKNYHLKRFLHLPKDMEVMKGLEIVTLSYCVVPKWIFNLQNLMELELTATDSSSVDDFRGLARIPHLRKVVLSGNYKCTEFPKEFGEAMAFPKLEWFEVNEFKCLEKFPSLHDNAMPMLKHFTFWRCSQLRNMPEGLERLKSLQKVIVRIWLDDPREAKDLRDAPCWKILKDGKVKIDLVIEDSKSIKDVGMEKDVNAITELLLKEDGPRFIAVVGMGGQGKTLLANRLFNGVRVNFDHHVWLTVSQNYCVRSCLLHVGRQIKLDQLDQNSSVEQLSVSIQKHLEERKKSLLLVLDEFWHTEAFDKIGLTAEAFDKIGLTAWQGKIKIVVTTRDKKVAEAMPNRYIHYMEPLTKELSSELFCIHAFPDLSKEQTPPPEFASIADRIVEKCSGLPLAVKTLGEHMATLKRLPNHWERELVRMRIYKKS